MIITNAEINPAPYGQSKVIVELNGTCEWFTLFLYYPDELSFSPSEFIGLTEDEGHDLFTRKDTAYLRS